MNLANTLTLFRFLLVPAVIVLIGQKEWGWAFALFVVAGLTDAIDGYVARRYNQMTEIGAYLDPLADKALLISIYIALAVQGVLPGWLAVLVVSRDVMIMGGVLIAWLVERPLDIRPIALSKANTVAQIAFAALKLAALAFALDLGPLSHGGSLLVAGLTLASMAAYLAAWVRHMSA